MTITNRLNTNTGVDLPKLEQASLAVLAGASFLDFGQLQEYFLKELDRPSRSEKAPTNLRHALVLVCVEAWLAYQGIARGKGLRENIDMRERIIVFDSQKWSRLLQDGRFTTAVVQTATAAFFSCHSGEEPSFVTGTKPWFEGLFANPSKICNLAGCALLAFGLFESPYPTSYIAPCFEKNMQHLDLVHMLGLAEFLIPDRRLRMILRCGDHPENPLCGVNPLLEVFYACLKECYTLDGVIMHVDRSNLANIIKNGHDIFNKKWLAALNVKLGNTDPRRHDLIKPTRLYEACIFYLQQTRFLSYGFQGSDPLFPEWRCLYDLLEFRICTKRYIHDFWEGRCVLAVSNENPPPLGALKSKFHSIGYPPASIDDPPDSRGIWAHPPLLPYEAWSVDGSHCGKKHTVYANSGFSKFTSWEQEHEERTMDWPGGHPLRKWHRIGTVTAQAFPENLRLNLGPICGKEGHKCHYMASQGHHPGCKGNNPAPGRDQVPFLDYWSNALSSWTSLQLYSVERKLGKMLIGTDIIPQREGTLEIPSGYQSFSSCAPPGSKVVSLDLKRSFAVHHKPSGEKFGSVHTDTTVDLHQTCLLSILAHEFEFGSSSCSYHLIHVHMPSPCNSQGLLNCSNGCSTDSVTGRPLEGWRGSECVNDRALAVKLWVTDVKQAHRVMFRPLDRLGGMVGAITRADSSLSLTRRPS